VICGVLKAGFSLAPKTAPKLAEMILWKLYLAHPWVLVEAVPNLDLNKAQVSSNEPSEVRVVLCCIICDLFLWYAQLDQVLHSTAHEMYDLRTAAPFHTFRKLATVHPQLVLRIVPTLTALLRSCTSGAAALSTQDLEISQRHLLYFRVLVIVELLRPSIWKVLKDCLFSVQA